MGSAQFGYKTAWLAFRTDAPGAVCDALGLTQLSRVGAESGLGQATEVADGRRGNLVFVSEPVDQWVLAVGDALLGYAEREPPDFGSLITRLSEELRCEVQFFCTHRVIEAHGWARAERGHLGRAFLFVGESGRTVINRGDQTREERSLGFSFFDPNVEEARDEGYWARKDLRYPEESDVMRLAGEWSINPEETGDLPDGWLGAIAAAPARSGRRWWRFGRWG